MNFAELLARALRERDRFRAQLKECEHQKRLLRAALDSAR